MGVSRHRADSFPYVECDCDWEFDLLRSAESGDPFLICPLCGRIFEITLELRDR